MTIAYKTHHLMSWNEFVRRCYAAKAEGATFVCIDCGGPVRPFVRHYEDCPRVGELRIEITA